MEKIGYPKGLVRYSSQNAVEQHQSFAQMLRRLVRPRILIYTVILWTIIIAAAFALTNRVPVKVDVIRDRVAMAAPDDPEVQNVYRLQIMNTSETPRRFRISASGLDGLQLSSEPQPIAIEAAGQRMIPVRLRVDKRQTNPGANRIVFTVQTVGTEEHIVITEKATLIAPRSR